jgi:hypothetical protein
MLLSAVLQATPVLCMDAEFGFPPWLFGMHSYEVLAGGKAALAVFDDPAAAGGRDSWTTVATMINACLHTCGF